jgi:hypothetical protein
VHLVQVLLPLPRDATAAPGALSDAVRELGDAFGGVTAHVRAPAKGRWTAPDGAEERDDVVVLEVEVGRVDRAWWSAFRERWETRLEQEELLVRSWKVRRL